MNFTPNDIQNILFKRSLFGFNQLQVEDVLDKVVEDLSDYIRENNKLKEKLDDIQDKLNYYKGIEQTLQNSLIVAQQTSDEIISNAKKNAENIVKEAELTARKIIEDANHEVLSIKYEYERLQRDVEAYRAKVESIIRAQLRSLQNLGGKEEAESEAV
ncbi:MAG: DivIVA domain-containing protein [Clostridiaceae bacterium]|nr:DivIVA domain-containing protein [Clostridiaceae bacterium]